MNDTVEDTLMQFLQSRLEPFTVPELLEFLGESVNSLAIEELSSFLIFNQLAYLNPGVEGSDIMWITRAGLFTGKPLIISPTNSEVVSGILIPGSRVVPFCNPSLLPHELTFRHKDKNIERVILECAPDEVYPHYQLFGDEYTPQYLSLDNEENNRLFNASDFEDPAVISISVLDMRELYWGAQFKAGDRLVARLLDWTAGVFEIGVLDREHLDLEKQALWMQRLEECLVQAFELAGPCASMDEQLSFAYFLGLEELFSPYATSITDFLRWSSRIAIEPYGVESRLWYSGDTVPSQNTWTMTLITSPESLVEEAFMHLALPLSSHILDSYIFDAFFTREKNPRELIKRLLPSRLKNAAFCVPVIERAIDIRFKQLLSVYNWFADHEPGLLRNRCIALHNALMRFILSLQHSGIEPDKIPDQGAVVLGQLLAHTISALENIDFSGKLETGDIDSLWASVEGMEDSFFEIKTAIQEIIPEINRKRFTIIKKEPPDERL